MGFPRRHQRSPHTTHTALLPSRLTQKPLRVLPATEEAGEEMDEEGSGHGGMGEVLLEEGEEADGAEAVEEEAEEKPQDSGLIVHKLFGNDVASELVGEIKEEVKVCNGHGALEEKEAGEGVEDAEGAEVGADEEAETEVGGKVCRCAAMYTGDECETPKQVRDL